jgi:peptidoglycan DL-endopeptidase CwlO
MTVTDTQRQAAVTEAKRIGFHAYPYAFGAAGPNAYDCSGLVMAAWAKAGVPLPHNSGMQAVQLDAVPYTATAFKKVLPGDMLFYSGTKPENVGHVAIYLENYDGMHLIAQATEPGVLSEVIRMGKYGKPVFIGYVR